MNQLIFNGRTIPTKCFTLYLHVCIDNKQFKPFRAKQPVETSKLILQQACEQVLELYLMQKCPFFCHRVAYCSYFFIIFLFFARVFCSILFGMNGGESEFPTYPLHCLILCSSAMDRWESQIQCPSYRIKLSKVEDLVINGILCRNTQKQSKYSPHKTARRAKFRDITGVRQNLFELQIHFCTTSNRTFSSEEEKK